MKSQASEVEYGVLARALDQLAARAPGLDAAELVALWPVVERHLLDCVSADERDEGIARARVASSFAHSEEERIRNLAWEFGVSVDLHAPHLGALRTLAKLLRERAQRLERRDSRAQGAGGSASP